MSENPYESPEWNHKQENETKTRVLDLLLQAAVFGLLVGCGTGAAALVLVRAGVGLWQAMISPPAGDVPLTLVEAIFSALMAAVQFGVFLGGGTGLILGLILGIAVARQWLRTRRQTVLCSVLLASAASVTWSTLLLAINSPRSASSDLTGTTATTTLLAAIAAIGGAVFGRRLATAAWGTTGPTLPDNADHE